LYSDALDIHQAAKYSFYDCLIIAGAKRANARMLYTEDLQDGQVLDGLRIVNPFRE
jgi:predicted nucleic acid-binding protein